MVFRKDKNNDEAVRDTTQCCGNSVSGDDKDCCCKEENQDNKDCCCKEDVKDINSCCDNNDLHEEKSCCKENNKNDEGEANACNDYEDTFEKQSRLIEELELKLKEAETKRDEYLAIAQRTQADFENYKRRNKAAVADAYKASAAETIEAFLPVMDNMERAYESAVAIAPDDSFVKGLEMMIRQFKDILAKFNVDEIDALGKPFDPELHNAFMQVDAEEGQLPDTVVEVLQKGYRMGDKVIRYSMVKVAK